MRRRESAEKARGYAAFHATLVRLLDQSLTRLLDQVLTRPLNQAHR